MLKIAGEVLQVGETKNKFKKWVEKARKEMFGRRCCTKSL